MKDVFGSILEENSDIEGTEQLREWGTYGDFELVGNGRVTNSWCGRFYYKGCDRVELHDKITLDQPFNGKVLKGQNFRGKVFVHKVYSSCDKPSCPVCYKYGWAVREAGKIEKRLNEASRHFGQVEHIVVSVPVKDYKLDLCELRSIAIRILTSCGVVGGVLIFHGFRYHADKHWFWNVHFHVLGFILGGYSRCRHCAGGNCYSCSGFEGRVYRLFRDEGLGKGYIVRCLDERKKAYGCEKPNIFGTAWYQLNHATIAKEVSHFRVATWFGVCSYRKLKVSPEARKLFCPICGHDLEKLRYYGRIDYNAGTYEGLCDFVADYKEDGLAVWVAVAEPFRYRE